MLATLQKNIDLQFATETKALRELGQKAAEMKAAEDEKEAEQQR